jgi:serine/threonine-protein kinase RsbW
MQTFGGLGISVALVLVLQVEPARLTGPKDKAMSQNKPSNGIAHRHSRLHPLETSHRILESTLEGVDSVERTAVEIAERAGFHGTDLEKIGVAVHEVVVNAIVHGNHLDCHKKVVVTILRAVEQIEVSVWDQGNGFDLQSLPDPCNPDVLLLPYGRGVYLARAFMDELYVQAGPANGTTVTMIKYIPFDEAPAAQGLTLAS